MKLNDPFVITISREVGSGGRTIGRKLAAKLAVHYSDKQLIDSLKEKFNLTASGIEKLKGEKKNWLADFIQFVAPVPKYQTLAETDGNFAMEFRPEVSVKDVYEAEKAILNSIADEGSCVIAGRSGFHVFKDHPNALHVFITASMPNRIERIMRKQGLTRTEAANLAKGIDEARENYIQRFAGVSRYDARNYDLVLNSDGHTEEQLADLILSYIG